MAKIKMGNMIVDIRGSIAGNTYSRNKAGMFARQKVSPVNPRTTYQQDVRSLFAILAQSWRGLTSSQRAEWNAVAPDWSRNNVFGDNVPLSGFQLYMRLNGNLQAIGEPTIDVPPVQTDVPGSLIVSGVADNSSNSLVITLDTVTTSAAVTHQIFATAALSPGKSFAGTQLRQIGIIADGTASPVTISTPYHNKFGNIGAVGQKIFIQLWPILTTSGIPGTSSMAEVIIQA